MGDSDWPSHETANKSSAGHRDPYEVLQVPRDATNQQIKTAYRKITLKLQPDKIANNREATEFTTEVDYAYGILSDPEKRRQYDVAGFEGVNLDGLDMELDLSNLGTVNTMFAALFSKLGVTLKTSISANVLEDALNGTATIRPLTLGQPVSDKVEKQAAHFFSVTISESQAETGVVVRVTSAAQSKFKFIYFEQEENDSLVLALQEDSVKTGKVTSAGMYFLHFQVYRLDPTINALAMAKDPDSAYFKKLDGLQPCEMSELKAGTHIFAVYGDNFFKSASYTIEAMCAESFKEATEMLKEVDAQMLAKRNELHEFEAEYQEVLARFAAVTSRYVQEKQAVNDLMKQREKIHELFSSGSLSKMASNSSSLESDSAYVEEESLSVKDGSQPESKDKASKKKWFNFKVL